MTIYIDILFAINFGVDYIILSLICGKNNKSYIKRAISSVIGALYSCLYFMCKISFLYSLPIKLFVLLLMCAICLCPFRIKRLIEGFFKAMLISVFFSGVIISVQFFSKGYIQSNLSDMYLSAGIGIGYFMFRFFISSIKKYAACSDCEVTIYYNNKKVTVHGICDSGNSLKDSITGLPVIIVDFRAIKRLFPSINAPIELSEFLNAKDFKVIPYKTISASGMVYGFIPQKLINANGDNIDAIVAAAPMRLEVDMLYNPMLLGKI